MSAPLRLRPGSARFSSGAKVSSGSPADETFALPLAPADTSRVQVSGGGGEVGRHRLVAARGDVHGRGDALDAGRLTGARRR